MQHFKRDVSEVNRYRILQRWVGAGIYSRGEGEGRGGEGG